jgi:hypothetical protein
MVVSAPKHGTHNSKLQLLQKWQHGCLRIMVSLFEDKYLINLVKNKVIPELKKSKL